MFKYFLKKKAGKKPAYYTYTHINDNLQISIGERSYQIE